MARNPTAPARPPPRRCRRRACWPISGRSSRAIRPSPRWSRRRSISSCTHCEQRYFAPGGGAGPAFGRRGASSCSSSARASCHGRARAGRCVRRFPVRGRRHVPGRRRGGAARRDGHLQRGGGHFRAGAARHGHARAGRGQPGVLGFPAPAHRGLPRTVAPRAAGRVFDPRRWPSSRSRRRWATWCRVRPSAAGPTRRCARRW